MINNLPTIFEVVTGAAKKQTKEKAPNSTNKPNKPSSKMVSSYTLLLPAVQHSAYNFLCLQQPRPESHSKAPKPPAPPKDDDESGDKYADEEEEERDNTLCGSCGTNDGKDEFWICCDSCERWYHGKCVKITPARAEHIKHYKCPDCGNKRARAQRQAQTSSSRNGNQRQIVEMSADMAQLCSPQTWFSISNQNTVNLIVPQLFVLL